MKKTQRTSVAHETLKIIEQGFYKTPKGQVIHLKEDINSAIQKSVLYRPEDVVSLPTKISQYEPQIQVTQETTLQATQRLYEEGQSDIYCLNFASAKNPGGGFLGGAQAQEESLARSSALYPCLTKHVQMYELNRHRKTMLYSDYMIYSPDVVVFRNDEGVLLEQPYSVTFISSAAVNLGALKRSMPHELPLVQGTLENRLEKILRIAIKHQHSTLVLGAWGCGVFANDAFQIAQIFNGFLGNSGAYHSAFKRIVYAIFDSSKDQKIYTPFQRVIKGA